MQDQSSGEKIEKRRPKNPIKFHVRLNEEQKVAKATMLDNPIVVLKGMAGSGKCLGPEYEIEIEVDEEFYNFLKSGGHL